MLCRYERTIFKSDKGFCIFSYDVILARSVFHLDKGP